MDTFGVEVNYDSFFLPIGKKTELEFEDFCALFKSQDNKDLLSKTLQGFSSSDDPSKKKDSFIFPIQTNKK